MGIGPVSAEQARVEQIARDYLTKNPGVLVEMATELDRHRCLLLMQLRTSQR